MDGDTIIAKILRAEGVEWMTCYPYQTLIEAGAKEGIRPIVCRQERAGVNMADGFSRISNGKRVGVFTMQRGPGAENAFGGVAQAFADSVPLLLFPGGEPAGRQGVPPTFGATRNYEGITKWSAHVNLVERIPEMLSRAFTQPQARAQGPGAPGSAARRRLGRVSGRHVPRTAPSRRASPPPTPTTSETSSRRCWPRPIR